MADSTEYVSFEDFIQSDLFTFLVGEEKRRFVVHSKAVAATSPVFDKLVYGGLRESQERIAELVDVDAETFTRFLEYAYRRDYVVPSSPQAAVAPGTRSNEMSDFGASSENVNCDSFGLEIIRTANREGTSWNSNSAPSDFGAMAYMPPTPPVPSIKKTKKLDRLQKTAFNNRQYIQPGQGASNLLRARFEPYPNASPTQDFAPVFLAHARLYTLADMRMVQPLKDLALHKLHKTLVSFELFPERLGDVVELARYAYENGADRAEDGRIDALRELVVNYVAREMKVLGRHAEFRDLMEAGDFGQWAESMQATAARPRLQRVRAAWDQTIEKYFNKEVPIFGRVPSQEFWRMADASVSVPFEEHVDLLPFNEITLLTSDRLIHSDLFTFIVGKECKTFVLHSKAVAATSPHFGALVNGALSEAQTRTAKLENVDPDTFTRFTEYAYRRDYTTPKWTWDEQAVMREPSPPTPLPPPPPPPPPAPDVEHPATDFRFPVDEPSIAAEPPRTPTPPVEQWGPLSTIGRKSKKHKKITMRSNFTKRTYLAADRKPRDVLISGFEPGSNTSAEQDFTSVFLAHAQLYTLADMRLVAPLKTLALHKLHSTLSGFSLYEERVGDILELAKYAYSQGKDRSEDGKLDELRDLVVRYIACEPKAFGKHKEFRYLMDSEGEFAGDLWDLITLELL
ncbi:hypothetical protein E8E12_009032 [Didymella heteroderae]|uniref:BTB domain-containing protein n=1 Tax=Didymella heteroderae TaxID=1769908 RepID=A0A9P5C3W9_9PLEO|nr:hypothetical protein E8E12_009032 [Didymella heteroderae]